MYEKKWLPFKLPFSINPCYLSYLVFQFVTYSLFSHLTFVYNLHWWTPKTLIDLSIPLFMPMVVPYVLYAPLILAPIVIPMKKMKEKALAFSLAVASCANYLLSFTISIAIPSRIPLIDVQDGPLLDILLWIYDNDPNGLYFPSLHVTHSLLIGFYFWEKGSYKRLVLPLSCVISLSTIFVKQHFLLDAIFGVLFSVGLYYGVPYLYKYVFKKDLKI